MNVPMDILWTWHDAAAALRHDAERAGEIELAEEAEKLRVAIDRYILQNADIPEVEL